MGRVELFRFTGKKQNVFYYQRQRTEIIGVYDKGDRQLKNNRYGRLPAAECRKLLGEIRSAIKKSTMTPTLMDKRIKLQLRTLGYIQ